MNVKAIALRRLRVKWLTFFMGWTGELRCEDQDGAFVAKQRHPKLSNDVLVELRKHMIVVCSTDGKTVLVNGDDAFRMLKGPRRSSPV